MIHAAAKMTAAIAVAAFSLSAAVAVAIFVATRDHGDLGKNSPDLVCNPLLQLFGIMAWVISFAFSALWLMTHCELFHSPCHLCRRARALSVLADPMPISALQGACKRSCGTRQSGQPGAAVSTSANDL